LGSLFLLILSTFYFSQINEKMYYTLMYNLIIIQAYMLQREGYQCVAIHGDLKQMDRERHLDTFRTGSASILVAT
jgi:RecG-like helicase